MLHFLYDQTILGVIVVTFAMPTATMVSMLADEGRESNPRLPDWMEIEKQRGISVTSSVLQFQYGGFCINILDTPGHQDFSEDTYRT